LIEKIAAQVKMLFNLRVNYYRQQGWGGLKKKRINCRVFEVTQRHYTIHLLTVQVPTT
jgi:hypothetical protein